MGWLGEYQQGDRLPITIWVRNASAVPTLPDDPPRAIVYNSTEQVESLLLPIIDTSNATALFHYDINLDGKYGTGWHTLQILYEMSSVLKSEIHDFNILAGGDGNGVGIAMEYFSVSPITYLVVQNDVGQLIRRKNPRVS